MSDNRVLGVATALDYNISELLRGVDRKKLSSVLLSLVGESVRITNLQGDVLLGAEVAETTGERLAITVELEPIGYLEVESDGQMLDDAKALVELVLQCNRKYMMASEIHKEVIHEDYDVLQKKHEALKQSEEQYRELSENLELRVLEQVKTIEQTQRQLYQSEKLASVGQLAAGVAHEINNPMGFVTSNLSTAATYLEKMCEFEKVLQRDVESETLKAAWCSLDLGFVLEDFRDLMDESQSGVERVARIVADLKDFTRVDHSSEEFEDVNHIISQVVNVTRSQLPKEIEVELMPGDIPSIRCNPGQLGQVFHNLLMNAAQSISDSGKIRFVTDRHENKIRVRVMDNGKGIPVDIQSRVFEPFYTTRDVGDGTGLGLTVSNDIVIAHGGRIELDSVQGRGTIVSLLLPLLAG